MNRRLFIVVRRVVRPHGGTRSICVTHGLWAHTSVRCGSVDSCWCQYTRNCMYAREGRPGACYGRTERSRDRRLLLPPRIRKFYSSLDLTSPRTPTLFVSRNTFLIRLRLENPALQWRSKLLLVSWSRPRNATATRCYYNSLAVSWAPLSTIHHLFPFLMICSYRIN